MTPPETVTFTLNQEDYDSLLELHRDCEQHWETVWTTAKECDNQTALTSAANWLAHHRWTLYILDMARTEK